MKKYTEEAIEYLIEQMGNMDTTKFKDNIEHPEHIKEKILGERQPSFSIRALQDENRKIEIHSINPTFNCDGSIKAPCQLSAQSLIYATYEPVGYRIDWAKMFSSRPLVITLIGSTKYKEVFEQVNELLSIQGHAVFTVCKFGHREGMDMMGPVKRALDKSYMFKIASSDAVYVVNPDGYIGLGTCDELHYALSLKKGILWLKEPNTWKEYYTELMKTENM